LSKGVPSLSAAKVTGFDKLSLNGSGVDEGILHMAQASAPVTDAIATIDDSILPALSAALDGLLDGAALARPGSDADRHATEIRYAAHQLAALGELLETVGTLGQASDEPPARMSA
jgi:hypothetical protein